KIGPARSIVYPVAESRPERKRDGVAADQEEEGGPPAEGLLRRLDRFGDRWEFRDVCILFQDLAQALIEEADAEDEEQQCYQLPEEPHRIEYRRLRECHYEGGGEERCYYRDGLAPGCSLGPLF